MADYKALQNGSDVRGVAISTDTETKNFSTLEAYRLGRAFVRFLMNRTGKKAEEISVYAGRDSRVTGEELKAAALSGIKSTGAIAYDTGLSSTPSMFMSTVFDEFKADGSIMLTASHLPFNRNGMKFFDKKGGLEKADISTLLADAGNDDAVYENKGEFFETKPLMKRYAQFLRERIIEGVGAEDREHPLKGLKIVVDAGNGAGGFFASDVLEPLGADTTGSVCLEPDGMFPNHEPNPENKKAMDSICKAVLDSGADLGLIFDTDVDRASAVDKYGRPINRNAIVALMAAIVSQYCPESIVVTDSVTSDKLTDFIENELHMTHRRFKRGYKNVINEAIRLCGEGKKCELAIETSGHCALGENFFLDDGAYVTVKILICAAQLLREGKTIDMLIASLKEAKEAKEFRLKINRDDFKAYGELVLDEFERYANECGLNVAPNSFEGVRVSIKDEYADGWMLIRMSLHDPLLPLNIESDTEGGVKYMAEIMAHFLESFPYVDSSVLYS